jgi:hypothetical protein
MIPSFHLPTNRRGPGEIALTYTGDQRRRARGVRAAATEEMRQDDEQARAGGNRVIGRPGPESERLLHRVRGQLVAERLRERPRCSAHSRVALT